MEISDMARRVLIVRIRASGPSPTSHSILDLGACWLGSGEEFSVECSMWDGANFHENSEAITGISEGRAKDPFSDNEPEAVSAFMRWADLKKKPVVLAGGRPGISRAWLLAAARRAEPWRRGERGPNFSLNVFDIHTLFAAREMRAGHPIPNGGFRLPVIAEALEVPLPCGRVPAIDAARREREMLLKLL